LSSGAKGACSVACFWSAAMRPEGSIFGKFQSLVDMDSQKVIKIAHFFCIFVQKPIKTCSFRVVQSGGCGGGGMG
jgi:hypothetical protein